MTKSKRASEPWMIFAFPQQHPPRANRFFARDGQITDSRDQAAKFATYYEAAEFAKARNIRLDGSVRYIGQQWRS